MPARASLVRLRMERETLLVFDGSFPGFLCALGEAMNHARKDGALPAIAAAEDCRCPGLFSATLSVPRDEERAAKVWRRIEAKAGAQAMLDCRDAFLSDAPGRHKALAHCLARLYREGPRALDDWADPQVALTAKACLRTRRQAHLICGVLRFSELADGSLYAPLDPDCDILPLLGDHFSARFPATRFVIHDTRRMAAIFHAEGASWAIVPGFEALGLDLPLSERERSVRAAWRRYFGAVSIKERENPRLQAAHMPKKYWKYLPEMEFPGGRGILGPCEETQWNQAESSTLPPAPG